MINACQNILIESVPPNLHCAPVVVYERRGPQKLPYHDNASFKIGRLFEDKLKGDYEKRISLVYSIHIAIQTDL